MTRAPGPNTNGLVNEWLGGAHAKTAERLMAARPMDVAAFLVEVHKVTPHGFTREARLLLKYMAQSDAREPCPGCGL